MTQALAVYEAQLVKIPTDDWNDSKTAFAVPAKKATALALLEAGFDAVRHLALYRGTLMVTNAGWWWWAERDPQFDGMRSRPIPRAEAADYGLEADEVGVLVDYFVKGSSRPIATGFGKASKRPYTYSSKLPEEQKKGHPDKLRNPLEADHPFRLAEKRAEGQAVKKARQLGFDVGVAEEAEPPRRAPEPRVAQRAPAAPKPPPTPGAGASTTDPGKSPPAGGAETVDPASIRNLGDLFSAANWVLHLAPSQVLAKLGVNTKEEIADIADAWVRLNEKPPQDPLEAAGL